MEFRPECKFGQVPLCCKVLHIIAEIGVNSLGLVAMIGSYFARAIFLPSVTSVSSLVLLACHACSELGKIELLTACLAKGSIELFRNQRLRSICSI